MSKSAGWLALALLLAVGTTTATAADKPAEKAAPVFSGFLGDYSKLQPAESGEGAYVFIDKQHDYSKYKKVMFLPAEVVLTPNPEYKGVQPDGLKKLTDGFLDSFRSALKPTYTVVSEPGDDVLTVRTAITGVQAVKPGMNATDLLPIKALFNLGRAAAGDAPMVAEMSAEMEVLDPAGNRLAAAVATRKGDQNLKQGEQVSVKDLQAITDYWAQSFRKRLDQLRGNGR